MSYKISQPLSLRISHLLKAAAMLMSAALILVVCSCHKEESDDSSMTDTLLKNYMNALCEFDISAMNESNLGTIEDYSDSDSVKSACKILAGKISWSADNVNINGNTAVVQLNITLPNDIEGICRAAFDNAMIQLEQETDKTPDELIRTQLKKYADAADTRQISAEISMCKVDNKWFINQSTDTATIISEIRTPAAAIYSMITQ
jgi:hypothetical protein